MTFSKSIKMLSPQAVEALYSTNSWLWAYKTGLSLVGNDFMLNGHEFQVRPMSIRPPIKVICKSTQMTFTESAVLDVLHGMKYGYYPKGVLYLFPTKDEVTDFSSSRFNPLIKENWDQIGRFVRETNRANLKRIGSAFLYFRSGRLSQDLDGQKTDTKKGSHLKSLPADHAVHDEYDEMSPKIDEYVDGRLSKSSIKTKTYLANPTICDHGIDKKFQLSDKEYWHIKCVRCAAWTCLDLDDNFPNLFIRRRDGSVIRACKKCHMPLDPRLGEWVPMHPSEKNIIGFTIGHPSAYWVDPKSILDAWEDPQTDKANFIRLRLGRAFIETENRITTTQVLDLCGLHQIQERNLGPCYMGVDQGKYFHIVISKKGENIAGIYLYIGMKTEWSQLDELMNRFNVTRCVVDGLPDQHKARAFAGRFPGRVFLNYYNEHQKGSYAWNEKEYTVSSNRTESLDASAEEVFKKSIVFPLKSDTLETFAKHLNGVAKKLEEDEMTGSKRYVYIKLAEDHYRHAFNYEVIARQGAPSKLFPNLKGS